MNYTEMMNLKNELIEMNRHSRKILDMIEAKNNWSAMIRDIAFKNEIDRELGRIEMHYKKVKVHTKNM